MKQLLIIGALTFVIANAKSQISKVDVPKTTEVGKIKKMGTFIASLEYYVREDNDTTYMLSYNDLTYTKITSLESIFFSGQDNTLNALYDAIAAAERAEKGTESTFKLGKETITLISKKALGQNYVYVYVDGKGYFSIEEKFLDRLFGRKAETQ
jgi:hypothetical protein